MDKRDQWNSTANQIMMTNPSHLFNIGDAVRFSKRVQPFNYMTIEAIDSAPLLQDTLYKMSGVAGWWHESSLVAYKEVKTF